MNDNPATPEIPLNRPCDAPNLDAEREAQHLEFRRRQDAENAARAQREREAGWRETERVEQAFAESEELLRVVYQHGSATQRARAAAELRDLGVDLEHEAAERKRGLLDAAQIFAPLPSVNWLCQALDIAPGAPLLLAGQGYSGKTVVVQDLALAVATGTMAWGAFPVRAGRVLHLDYEQGAYLTKMRYQRLAKARGIDPRALDGRLQLACFPDWYVDGDTHDELPRLCEGIDLLIIDSFRAACPSTDENASEARLPLDRLARISEATGVTAAMIHHSRKPTRDAAGGQRASVRGSGALFDASGSVLCLSADKGKPVEVAHEKARISGRTHDDFRLWIEDVEIDGNPAGGLRVSRLNADAPQAQQTPSAYFAVLKSRVLELVRQGPVAGGVNVLRARLGGRKDDIGAAVAELVQSGALKRGGTYHAPVLTAVGTDHDSQ